MSSYISPAWAVVVMAPVLVLGVYVVAVLDRVAARFVAERRVGIAGAALAPLTAAAVALRQRPTRTEHPDAQAWALAPALLMGCAAVGLAVIPMGPSASVADPDSGFVVYSAAIAFVMVAVYLHGWSPNSTFPLIGGYRFIAQALSFQIPFLLVLLGPALPAESLAIGDFVDAQDTLWNVVRQPLGLPIFLIVAAAVTFSAPADLPDATDLAGGTLAEVSGRDRALWRAARAALLVTVAAMGATAFLGGWQGPVLPGWAWVVVKTLAVLTVLVGASHAFARVRIERFVVFCWVVLLPLSLVNIFVAGAFLL